MRMEKMKRITIVLMVMIIATFYNGIDLKTYKYRWEGMDTEGDVVMARKGNMYYYKTEIGFMV